MSRYPKDLITCGKCGQTFSTHIDRLEHKKYCQWTRTNFPNGSIWMHHDHCEAGHVKAKNPFGTFWIMRFQTGVHNHGYGDYGIFRKGRKWRLHKTDEGWTWI